MEELFQEAERLITKSIEDYRKLAGIIKELDDRNADMSRLESNPLFAILRKVGHGQLALEAVANLPFHVLKRVEHLPMRLQLEAADPETEYPVVGVRSDGATYSWKKRPSEMTSGEASVVFAPDHVRNEREMTALLRMKCDSPKNVVMTDRPKITTDHKRRGLVVTVGTASVFIGEEEALLNLSYLAKGK